MSINWSAKKIYSYPPEYKLGQIQKINITPYPHEYKLGHIQKVIIILHTLVSINWGTYKK
jgi:hypothetical protein